VILVLGGVVPELLPPSSGWEERVECNGVCSPAYGSVVRLGDGSISEEFSAFVFRVNEDGGSTFLRITGNHRQVYSALQLNKTSVRILFGLKTIYSGTSNNGHSN
jgi:hypothetical protein